MFRARRAGPRKIGFEDEEESSTSEQSDSVVRPSKGSSKVKKSSGLRLSFQIDDDAPSNESESAPSRKRRPFRNLADDQFKDERKAEESKPKYSKTYLEELRQAQRIRPDVNEELPEMFDQTTLEEPEDRNAPSSAVATRRDDRTSTAYIPSEAEIREKKERRARLAAEEQAQEEDYISLNDAGGIDRRDVDPEYRHLIPRSEAKFDKYGRDQSRLAADDADVLEGFDEMVEDGHLALGRNAQKQEKRRKKEEIRAAIASAQHEGEEQGDKSASEDEREAAFDAAQTKAGRATTGPQQHNGDSRASYKRPRVPAHITSLSDLAQVLAKHKARLQALQEQREREQQRIADLKEQQQELLEQERFIQTQLNAKAEEYEKLRAEAGMEVGAGFVEAVAGAKAGEKIVLERGLESFGNTPLGGTPLGATPIRPPIPDE